MVMNTADKHGIIKNELDPALELANLEKCTEELSDIDDLWYFIRSSLGAWIAGSAR